MAEEVGHGATALLWDWNLNGTLKRLRKNERKHRVTFDEASSVFGDELSVTIFDPLHSDDEDRFVIMGMSNKWRLVAVCFTDRDERIRIISARVASKRERKTYEEGG